MRIVMLAPGGIGDYLLLREHVREVLRRKPAWRLCWFVPAACRGLADVLDRDWAGRMRFVDFRRLHAPGYRLFTWLRIRACRADLALCPGLSRQFWVDWLVRHSGAAQRIGSESDLSCMYADDRELTNDWYTRLVPVVREFPRFEWTRYQEFFSSWLQLPLPGHTLPDLPAWDVAWLRRPFVVLCPGGGSVRRCWPPAQYGQVAQYLIRNTPCEVVILGSQADQAAGRIICHAADGSARCRDLTGQTALWQSWVLLQQAQLAVVNDSAASHMAALANRPYVCISNGNDYGRFHPYPPHLSAQGRYLFPAEFAAQLGQPGFVDAHYGKASPYDIASIRVEEVIAAIEAVRARGHNEAGVKVESHD